MMASQIAPGLFPINGELSTDSLSILIVEDEGLIAMDLKRRLERFGYSVVGIASNADQAVAMAGTHRPGLILMDIRLEGPRDGIAAADEVRQTFDIPIIFLTAHSDAETIRRAKLSQPFGYLMKPFGASDLHAHIEIAHYRHNVERKIRNSHSWLAATLSCVGDGVITTNVAGAVEFMNPAAEALTGWKLEAALGHPILTVLKISPVVPWEAFVNPLKQIFQPKAGPAVLQGEYLLNHRHGNATTCIIHTTVTLNRNQDGVSGAVVAFQDITVARELEKQVRVTSKMNAVSVMAGALAHDFNNLLTVILGYCDLIDAQSPHAQEAVAQVRNAGEAAAALSLELLTASRTAQVSLEPLDLNAVINTSAKMLRQILTPKCALVLDTAHGPLEITAGRLQLQQVLIGLVGNARDSMPHGGTLTIRTTRIARDRIEMIIQDSGTGMSPETRERIFEPFFTRKGRVGSGLGMAMVHGLIMQLGGTIEVESQPGAGATFRITLAAVASGDPPSDVDSGPAAQDGADSSNGTPPTATPPEARGTLLLVEDDDGVRRLFNGQLKRAGFNVLEACSGMEALALLNQHGDSIDLLVTDVMMTKMSGVELAERVVARLPGTPVIFVSGFAENFLDGNPLLASGQGRFLAKPISAKGLVTEVNEILGRNKIAQNAQ